MGNRGVPSGESSPTGEGRLGHPGQAALVAWQPPGPSIPPLSLSGPAPPLAAWARPLSQGPLFLKSLWCSCPKPEEQCQPQGACGLGLGPRGAGGGASSHPTAAGVILRGLLGQLACHRPRAWNAPTHSGPEALALALGGGAGAH